MGVTRQSPIEDEISTNLAITLGFLYIRPKGLRVLLKIVKKIVTYSFLSFISSCFSFFLTDL